MGLWQGLPPMQPPGQPPQWPSLLHGGRPQSKESPHGGQRPIVDINPATQQLGMGGLWLVYTSHGFEWESLGDGWKMMGANHQLMKNYEKLWKIMGLASWLEWDYIRWLSLNSLNHLAVLPSALICQGGCLAWPWWCLCQPTSGVGHHHSILSDFICTMTKFKFNTGLSLTDPGIVKKMNLRLYYGICLDSTHTALLFKKKNATKGLGGTTTFVLLPPSHIALANYRS